jgi:hypothetical protein
VLLESPQQLELLLLLELSQQLVLLLQPSSQLLEPSKLLVFYLYSYQLLE